VQLLIRLDRRRGLKYATLSSHTAKSLQIRSGRECLEEDTVMYYSEGRLLCMSDAALAILKELGPPWSLLRFLGCVPRSLRDRMYRFLARGRYRLFGRYEQCMLPDEKDRERFLY